MNDIVNFLSMLFEQGLSYSAVNTARSALSTSVNMGQLPTCGEHPTVKRFMRGVFQKRPTRPKYVYTWDAEIVLLHLENLQPLQDLSLKDLTMKLVTTIALITGQRCQTIFYMNLKTMQKTNTKFRFIIEHLIKTSKPGKEQPILILPKFEENEHRCVYKTLKRYLEVTAPLRKGDELFISFIKPHAPVSKDTISRWVRTTLEQAGIDTEIFKSHSTRSAATSAARRAMIPMSSIMRAASWESDNTFRRFYNKPLQKESDFALSILKNSHKDELQ